MTKSYVEPRVPAGAIPADVDLAEIDGNVFYIIGAVRRGLREAGNSPEVIESFTDQACHGDYDHALRVVMAFTESRS